MIKADLFVKKKKLLCRLSFLPWIITIKLSELVIVFTKICSNSCNVYVNLFTTKTRIFLNHSFFVHHEFKRRIICVLKTIIKVLEIFISNLTY